MTPSITPTPTLTPTPTVTPNACFNYLLTPVTTTTYQWIDCTTNTQQIVTVNGGTNYGPVCAVNEPIGGVVVRQGVCGVDPSQTPTPTVTKTPTPTVTPSITPSTSMDCVFIAFVDVYIPPSSSPTPTPTITPTPSITPTLTPTPTPTPLPNNFQFYIDSTTLTGFN
jgi:type VI secretion system secreted protein VgrG